MYDGLKVGAIDAMMDDYPVIGYAIKQGQELETPIKKNLAENMHLPLKGQNPELLNMFNEGLKELKEQANTIRLLKNM